MKTILVIFIVGFAMLSIGVAGLLGALYVEFSCRRCGMRKERKMASDFNPSDFDIPREKERTDTQRADINIAWKFVDGSTQLLDSTDGHLAVLRAIQYGRRAALDAAARVDGAHVDAGEASSAVDGDAQWNAIDACERLLDHIDNITYRDSAQHRLGDTNPFYERARAAIRSLKRG